MNLQNFSHPFSTEGEAIELADLLNAREQRAALQQQLLAQHPQPLLCVTLTAVGGVKKNALLDYAFEKVLAKLTALFAEWNLTPTVQIIRPLLTGHEAYFSLSVDGETLKRACIALEDASPLARLLDLDVFDATGNLLSRSTLGFPPRSCLVCGKDAKICARTRAHCVDHIIAEMQQRAKTDRFADHIAALVQQALLEEARLSPKPGLVDVINNGAHRDMDLRSFEQSAAALKPFFAQFVLEGAKTANLPVQQLLAQIRPIGLQAEKKMFEATGNVNTHKGAIFAFGLVCTALGRLFALQKEINLYIVCDLVAQMTQGITQELRNYPIGLNLTAGVKLYRQYGLTGARGEAEQGFPMVKALWDVLSQLDKNFSDKMRLSILNVSLADGLEEARNTSRISSKNTPHFWLIGLLFLMANNQDTNVVHRGGIEGLNWLQQRAQQLLTDQQIFQEKAYLVSQLAAFDADCISKNLSAGGSADLLALTIFFFNLLR